MESEWQAAVERGRQQALDGDLFRAAAKGDLAGVIEAQKNGSSLHAFNEAALRSAALNGHLEIVKYLIAAGAEPSVNGNEALYWAGLMGHADVSNILLDEMDRRAHKGTPPDPSPL